MQVQRQSMNVDIACVGFGPATGGFLKALSKALDGSDGREALQSRVMPGSPLQVLCYERADDIGFGVSGIVTRAEALAQSFSAEELSQVPMTARVDHEEILYLLDPHGASRRSALMKAQERLVRMFGMILPFREHALKLPYIPPFLRKDGGMILSMGQFMQWVGSGLMASGAVQIWPGMPVQEALIEDGKVAGIRLADQGVDGKGAPAAAYMPGMDIRAELTVVGDGPVGPVGLQIDERFGMPEGHHRRDWAIGMKFVIELPEGSRLKSGTVLHTFGYPEPEIFGFLYVLPGGLASAGIFVPSWFDSPVRTAYKYLQHWMRHPYLWRNLEGGTLRSWGAKSILESGEIGEPHLAGDGYARIGEGSGSTNVLKNSGVDEAWETGVQLAEGVIEILRNGKDFTRENLEQSYVRRRRESRMQAGIRKARHARDGFQKGFMTGMIGMGMAGLTGGALSVSSPIKRPHERIPTVEEYFKGRISAEEIGRIRAECGRSQVPLHEKLMERCGWPRIPLDGKLMVSHQDALLMGGKVQAAEGYADHVRFADAALCGNCAEKICIEGCSGQAIMSAGEGQAPAFDREKCVHCGACYWNCSKARQGDPEKGNIDFGAGSGGLHSAEN